MSLYQVLGVATNADEAAIRRAHREAMAALPATRSARLQAWWMGRSRRHLDEALAVLSHPARRAAYDRSLSLDLVLAQAPPGH
jgi:DnaJ-class molecular chaperone